MRQRWEREQVNLCSGTRWGAHGFGIDLTQLFPFQPDVSGRGAVDANTALLKTSLRSGDIKKKRKKREKI